MDIRKIIKRTAKEKFSGYGIKQKGQSRLWYFSAEYYMILIEFQPSSWDDGTYLNVGLDFNWYPKNYFAFEFGHRLSDFKKSSDEEQFQREVERLCNLAIDRFQKYKDIFTDNESLASKLIKLQTNKENDWEQFHIGVAYGLGGHKRKAVECLSKVSGNEYQLDWERQRAALARSYLSALETGDFLTKLSDTIKETKALKGID